MRIRLLNPSIFGDEQQGGTYDPMHDLNSYPVVVNAEYREDYYLSDRKLPKVTYSELDRVFPVVFSWGEEYSREKSVSVCDGLTWWPREDGSPSFEEVSPFDYWNKLKSSRTVGDVVPAGYL